MTKQLTKSQVADITKAFLMFDKKRKGYVTSTDISRVLKEQGQQLTDGEIRQMVGEVDTKGNGRIEIEGFISMMAKFYAEKPPEPDVKDKFENFDVDGKGYVTAYDIMLHMSQAGQVISIQDAEGMLKYADTNGDGQLSFEEFQTMYLQLLQDADETDV